MNKVNAFKTRNTAQETEISTNFLVWSLGRSGAKLCGTCAENFRTRKSGEILVFCARIGNFRNSFLKFEQ